MRVFVVIARSNTAGIKAAIGESGLPYHDVKDDIWLVAASDVTTRELAENLGIRKGNIGSGLVVSIDAYSGRMPADTWEWLKIHEARSE